MKYDRVDTLIMIGWGSICLAVLIGGISYMMTKPKDTALSKVVEPIDLVSDCITVQYHDKTVVLDEKIRKACEKITDTWRKARNERSLRRLKETLNGIR